MKRYLALVLAGLMLTVLLTGCGKTDSAEGKYYAISCAAEGEQYSCFGEYVLLQSDGSGVVCYDGEDRGIRYSYAAESGEFTFKDEDNFRFEGSLVGDQLSGVYGDRYDYVYTTIGTENGADYAGEYAALSCRMSGTDCYCGDDALTLYENGKGLVSLNGEKMDILWKLSGTAFCFYSEKGSMTDGQYADGQISGSCFGADYVFSCREPEEETPEETAAPIEYHDEGVYNENGVIMGTYGATKCTDEAGEHEYYLDGEYLILHEDGSGVIRYMRTEFAISWESDGKDFLFTDADGDGFAGTYADGVIDGVYYPLDDAYHYVFTYGEEPLQEEY